jgi:uncharacterized protein (TIGR03067 family)
MKMPLCGVASEDHSMTITTPCPDPTRLSALLHGALSDTEQNELTIHLETCTTCQETLQGLAAGSGSWDGVAQQLGSDDTPAESALHDLMNRMAGATLQSETQTGGGTNHVDDTSLSFLGPAEKPGHLGRLSHYEILEVIGRGAFGVVLKAFDPKLHRVVAIKVLAPSLATSASARRRFEREAKSAAAVSHDHVVAIYAVEDASDPPYLVMYYVDGQSLQQRVDRDGPMELKEILRISLQAARGLAAAHSQGLVHRDIKPANILLENGVERVKLTDFGLARAADDASLTQSGVIAGTPQFMSPEQAGGHTVDHRSDLFSLGSVLYFMCTGRPPFRASTTMGVLKRVCEEQTRPIRDINPEIPEWLCNIIAKLHAKEPADRFQSAKDVGDLLGQHLAHLHQPDAVAMPVPVVLPAGETQPRQSMEPQRTQPRVPRILYWLLVPGIYVIAVFVLLMQGFREASLIAAGIALPAAVVIALLERHWLPRRQGSRGRESLIEDSHPRFALVWTPLVALLILTLVLTVASVSGMVLHVNMAPGENMDLVEQVTIFTGSLAGLCFLASIAIALIRPHSSPLPRAREPRATTITGDLHPPAGKSRWPIALAAGLVFLTFVICGLPLGALISFFVFWDVQTVQHGGLVPHETSASVTTKGPSFGGSRPGTPPLTQAHLTERANRDEDLIQGRWVPVSAEITGRQLPQSKVKEQIPTLLFKGQRWGSVTTTVQREGPVDLNSQKNPKEIDFGGSIFEDESKGAKGIYRFEDDRLHLCLANAGKPRPTEFTTTPLNEQIVIVYQRQSASSRDEDKLQGTWQLVSLEEDGKTYAGQQIPTLSNMGVSFTGQLFQLKLLSQGGEPPVTGMKTETNGVFHLDCGVDPRRITVLTPGSNANSLLGIYKVEGDTLTLCHYFNPKEVKYPTQFATKPKDGALLLVFKRQADTDEGKLQGTWKSTSVGPAYTDVTFTGNQFQLKKLPKGNPPVESYTREYSGTFQLNTTTTPKRIAVTHPTDKAKGLLGIYRLEGDTLFFCYRGDPKDGKYPSQMTTNPAEGSELLVLRRYVPRPASAPAQAGSEKPERVIKQFGPADWPLNREQIMRRGDAWRIELPAKTVVKLFRVEKPGTVERGVFVFRGQIKTDDFKDQNDLAIGGDWEDASGNLAGSGSKMVFPSADWKPWLVNPNTKTGDHPAIVELDLQNRSDKPGTVWIKDVELVEFDRLASSSSKQAGWIPLFNGKDLSGWKPSADTAGAWTAESGILKGTKHAVLLTSQSAYHNFRLRAEVKVSPNGKVAIKCRQPAAGLPPRPIAAGYEVVLITGSSGTKLGNCTQGGATLTQAVPANEWLTVEIVALGRNYTSSVQGTTKDDNKGSSYGDPKDRDLRGSIVLESRCIGTVAEFRRLEIQELPPVNDLSLGELRRLVELRELQAKHASERFQKGAEAKHVLIAAEIEAGNARIDLAEAEFRFDDALAAARQLVAKHEELVGLIKLLHKAGRIALEDVTAAEIALTQARLRLARLDPRCHASHLSNKPFTHGVSRLRWQASPTFLIASACVG